MFGLVTKKQLGEKMEDYWKGLHSLDESYVNRRAYLKEKWEKEIRERLNRFGRMIEDLKRETYRDIGIVKKHLMGEFHGLLATIMSMDLRLSKLQGDLLKKEPFITEEVKHYQIGMRISLNQIIDRVTALEKKLRDLTLNQEIGPICFECEHGKWRVRQKGEYVWNEYDCTHPVHHKKDIDPGDDGCKDFKEEVIT